MKHRILVALATAFIGVGSALAQAPVATLTTPPPLVAEGAEGCPTAFDPECAPAAGPCRQFWASGDFLLGWVDSSRLPPLVTSSPSGTPQTLAGTIGGPTTQLFGGDVDAGVRSGFRLQAGYWFFPEQYLGIEAGFSLLESRAASFGASSNGSPILARPFISALDDSAQSVLIAYPGVASGTVGVRAESGNFYEFHADLAERFQICDCFHLDALVGYRFYQYGDDVRIQQRILPTNPNFAAGTVVTGLDDFNARNDFNGCDLGMRMQFAWGNLALDLLAKTAFGSLHQAVNISGGESVSVPGVPVVNRVGGLYALPSNIVLDTHNEFALLPELGANLSWRVNDNLRLTFGYSMYFLDSIVRAADLINLTVNPNLFQPAGLALGGPNEPAAILRQTGGTWIQTLNFGVEVSF